MTNINQNYFKHAVCTKNVILSFYTNNTHINRQTLKQIYYCITHMFL